MMQIITLSNGKRVGNFSSHHPFIFEDGNILPACSKEESDRLSVNIIEEEHDKGDVALSFEIPQAVSEQITAWMQLFMQNKVDVVFCPNMMITALRAVGFNVRNSPFRSIRRVERNTNIISIHKQCL